MIAQSAAIRLIERQYAFNLDYARALVADLTEAQMCAVPGDGHENHPAFTLGHLCCGAAMAADDLGAPSGPESMDGPIERTAQGLPEGWTALFERRGPADRRLPALDVSYPSKEALLAELEHQHARVVAALLAADPGALEAATEWRLCPWMPTLLDAVNFFCSGHEALHLGQLAAWRRAMGLPAAMAQMGR